MKKPGDESDRVHEPPPPRRDVGELFREGAPVDRALKRAAQEALRRHKRLGHPVAVWQGGRVVWLPPDEIRVSD